MTLAEKIYQKLKSAPVAVAQEVLDFLEFLEARARRGNAVPVKTFDDLFGALKDTKPFDGDPVVIQRTLRNEWR